MQYNPRMVAAGLIGAAAGGMVVNLSWYRATSKFLAKRQAEDKVQTEEQLSDNLFTLMITKQMDEIAQNSKGMSQSDKLKIKELHDVAWMKKTAEEKMSLLYDLKSFLLETNKEAAA